MFPKGGARPPGNGAPMGPRRTRCCRSCSAVIGTLFGVALTPPTQSAKVFVSVKAGAERGSRCHWAVGKNWISAICARNLQHTATTQKRASVHKRLRVTGTKAFCILRLVVLQTMPLRSMTARGTYQKVKIFYWIMM